ncbi:MAG: formylglycine-generating enzyme family protein, partial [Planctomycetes bacterium]|nr:formylglycine-generating enzyme family protein [Planctomycetota bacterium]
DLDLAGELLRGPDTQFRLTVESDSGRSGQEVRLQRVDPATGQLAAPELLGTAPLADVAVAAGLYRLTVVEAGYGFAELVVALRPSVRPAVLRAFVRASTDVTATMREIAAGPFEVRQTAFLSPEVGVDEIALPYDVAGFWLDPRPVTNADYEAFCAATGHRRPAFWPAPPYPTEWADKPVVMVALDDARRFAEWSGKRLPTRAEWELAARGSERAKFPWRTDDVTPLREAVVGRAQLDVAAYLALPDRAARLAFEFEHYLRTVADVGHLRPAARGPHDLHDLVGNVWEWVDARPFNYVDGEVVVATDSAYRLGAYYGVARDTAERAGLERYSEAFAFEPHSNTGFRCAKSRAPLQR